MGADDTETGMQSLGLTEIDPSPVEETPGDSSKGGYFPSGEGASPPLLAQSSTLGLRNHGVPYYRMMH